MANNEQKGLKPQEELFCQYYAKSGHAFGNATMAYALAYKKDLSNKKQYRICSVEGSKLLTKPDIYHRKEEILAETITDEIADKELAKVILQDEERKVKVAAISEFNKVRGRHTERHQHKFEGVSSEALAERAAELLAGIISDRGGVKDKDAGE